MRPVPLVVAFVAVHSVAIADAKAQWADGAFATTNHTCWQGTYPAIPEALAYTYVGVDGAPAVGDTYYMRISVAGLGCSGAWAFPEVKLPPNTQFAIDASHPIRCYLGPFDAAPQLTDGSCPAQPSSVNPVGLSDFVSFPPTTQPYWPLPPGKLLRIEFPVRSSAQLLGIGSANDFLIGAVQFLDNSPGNPVPSYSEPAAGYTTGVPSDAAWTGVYVAASAASRPTNPLVAFAEPSATNIAYVSADSSVHVTLTARVTNPLCMCDAGAVSGATCSARSLAFNIQPVAAEPDTTFAVGGSCDTSNSTEYVCTYEFGGLIWGHQYEYNYAGLPGSVYFAGSGCAATGQPLPSTGFRDVTPHDPSIITYTVIATASGTGSVALSPEGGAYQAGQQVTLTATAGSSTTFSHWLLDGATNDSGNPLQVTANVDHAVVAVFAGIDGGDGGGGGDGGIGGPDFDQPDTGSNNGSSHGGCSAAGPAVAELAVLIAVLVLLRRWRFSS